MEPSRRRALLADAAIVASTAAWPLVLAQEVEAGAYTWPTGGRLVVEVAAAVAAVVLLLTLRRRAPVGVALGILPAIVSPFAVVPSLVALYTVAATHRWPVAAGIAVGYLGISLGAAAVLDPPDAWAPRILLLAAFHAVPVAAGMARNARLALLRELEGRVERAEAEQAARVERARRLERQRIAREMHDVVAHRISLVSLHAGALTYRPDASPVEIARAAEVIRTSAHDALEELRRAIDVLRESPESPTPELPQPTLVDLPALVERCRSAGTRLTVDDHALDTDAVPPVTARTAYRVLEEALTNAVKHAPASPVDVVILSRGSGDVEVEVTNPLPLSLGSQREPAVEVPGAGAGLVGLAERLELAGGRLDHGPTGDGRFLLRAEIPGS